MSEQIKPWQERAEALPREQRQDERMFMRAEIEELRAYAAKLESDAATVRERALEDAITTLKKYMDGYDITSLLFSCMKEDTRAIAAAPLPTSAQG